MSADQNPIAAPHAVAGVRRVLIVDDHAPTRAAITALLEPERPRIEVVATASDGATAICRLSDTAPDVVVLDLNLGDEFGLNLMPEICCHKGVAVIILTASGDSEVRRRALAAGAAAFVSKLSPARELIAAILTVQPASA